MRVALECIQGIVFDWCWGMIPIMRKQLSDHKRGRRKNFGYSSILAAFFFKRFPSTILAIPLPTFSPHHPRLAKWGEVFLHQGGRGSVHGVYDDEFYVWWEWQFPTLE